MAAFENVVWLILTFFFVSEVINENAENTNIPSHIDDIELKDLVVIVLSQPNTYHKQRAKLFTDHFQKQLTDISQENQPELYLLHKKWPSTGSWTILPIIQSLDELFQEKAWIIFVEEETRIDLKGTLQVLQKYSHKQKYFLGKALFDKSPTIIHHFAFFDDSTVFKYPDPAAGMCFSQGLLKSLSKRLSKKEIKTGFTIDFKHELAMFINNENKGVNLTDVKEFCTISDDKDCVTTSPFIFPKCGPSIQRKDLYIGVKTCEKFHKDRIPVVKETWGKENIDIEYFSETEDISIPTINLGVANTERGHCEKTISIIRRFIKEEKYKNKQWLLIADDDTIINLKRLRRLLSCYNSEEKVALGERYGYGVSKGFGYDYITGGGGMIFSRPVANFLAEKCSCPSIDSPDDMTIGMCLKRKNIPITHSRYIHQARPEDYSVEFLSHQLPVSFHKHWNVDPYKVYQLLIEDDLPEHDEL